MKILLPFTLLFVAICAFSPLGVSAEARDFPGVEKAMTPEQYERAGLQKLTPEERARLDEFIRGFVSSSTQVAATKAVDQAVAERKVAPPEVIESRIVGPFTGYNGNTIFTLENGQRWQQSQPDSRYFPKVDSPTVTIVKGTFGYRMYITGGGNIRVRRVR
jgi:hypothetical protein